MRREQARQIRLLQLELSVEESILTSASRELSELATHAETLERDLRTIHSSDPAAPIAQVAITGTGMLAEPVVEEFIQEGNNATDILWVVDNSCSMGGEQTSLAVNFSSFIQIVDALDMDYHIGVTTTDTGDNGALEGSTPIVTPSTVSPRPPTALSPWLARIPSWTCWTRVPM